MDIDSKFQEIKTDKEEENKYKRFKTELENAINKDTLFEIHTTLNIINKAVMENNYNNLIDEELLLIEAIIEEVIIKEEIIKKKTNFNIIDYFENNYDNIKQISLFKLNMIPKEKELKNTINNILFKEYPNLFTIKDPVPFIKARLKFITLEAYNKTDSAAQITDLSTNIVVKSEAVTFNKYINMIPEKTNQLEFIKGLIREILEEEKVDAFLNNYNSCCTLYKYYKLNCNINKQKENKNDSPFDFTLLKLFYDSKIKIIKNIQNPALKKQIETVFIQKLIDICKPNKDIKAFFDQLKTNLQFKEDIILLPQIWRQMITNIKDKEDHSIGLNICTWVSGQLKNIEKSNCLKKKIKDKKISYLCHLLKCKEYYTETKNQSIKDESINDFLVKPITDITNELTENEIKKANSNEVDTLLFLGFEYLNEAQVKIIATNKIATNKMEDFSTDKINKLVTQFVNIFNPKNLVKIKTIMEVLNTDQVQKLTRNKENDNFYEETLTEIKKDLLNLKQKEKQNKEGKGKSEIKKLAQKERTDVKKNSMTEDSFYPQITIPCTVIPALPLLTAIALKQLSLEQYNNLKLPSLIQPTLNYLYNFKANNTKNILLLGVGSGLLISSLGYLAYTKIKNNEIKNKSLKKQGSI